MKTILQKANIFTCLGLIVILIAIQSCRKNEYTISTTEDVNITGYLEKFPEKFSLMSQVIAKAGAEGYLGAYGSYTLFTPTNEAITAWLKNNNKSSVSELSAQEAKDMVNYHLVMDTLNTKNFSDGKLQSLTQYGQYITTGVVTAAGVSSYTLNRNARIVQTNVRVGNGVLQIIDQVLVPPAKTLAELIAENPRYEFFEQALRETGFFDSLNVQATATNPAQKFRTVIAESDSAIKAAGFPTYAAFKQKLSTKGKPQDHTDSLWLYVAYHVAPSANYVADIASVSSLSTLVPSEIITTKYANLQVLLNEVEFDQKLEPGAPINNAFSNVSASNGVLHEARDFFKIKVRIPTALYWDMELDGLSQNPRHPLYLAGNIQLHPNGASFSPGNYANSDYSKISSNYAYPGRTDRYTNKNDYLALSLVGPANNGQARPLWHEFRTPLLVKGQYKVWICYSYNSGGGSEQWTMNPGTPEEQVMPNSFGFNTTLSASGVSLTAANSDNLMEAAGYKRYMAVTTETAVNANGQTISGDVPANNNTAVGRLIGIATIRTTGRQIIRVTGLGGLAVNTGCWLDMIHFIPLDKDQQYPRFSRSGTKFNRK